MNVLEKTVQISVIIPIYNMDAYLGECLDSVLNQTMKDFEIICVNDGSTDNSQVILNEYSWRDPRIKVISQTNHGVAYARNAGIDQASGEYLFFLDPDDWLPDEDVFSDMYTAAKENHALICGGTFSEYVSGKRIERWTGNMCKYEFYADGMVSYADYQFDYGWVRFIYNREFLIQNNLRLPLRTYFEDPVFFVRAMHKAKCFYALKRCTYCYRTGYKSDELSYEKIVDLMKGMYDNISFAKEHGYINLLALELARIENEYAERIVPYLINPQNTELRGVFDRLNSLIYDDNSRLEYRMYYKIIGNRNSHIGRLDEEKRNLIDGKRSLEEENRLQGETIQQLNTEISESERRFQEEKFAFYQSRTWRIGHLVLYIPKRIKGFLLKKCE